MALNVCAHCTTKFAIGVPHCPQCGNADYYEEGTMAKISRHGGPTHLHDTREVVVELPADVAQAEPPAEEDLGEEPVALSVYDTMLRTDLQDLCRERGLPTSGNKDEIVARLVAADAAAALEE